MLLKKPINCLHFPPGGSSEVVSVRPSRKWFKTLSACSETGWIPLGNNYFAFYVKSSDNASLCCRGIRIAPEVYIFRKRFGRFYHVDLSDRLLFESLKKITREG